MFWLQFIRVPTEALKRHEGWLNAGSLKVYVLHITVILVEVGGTH